MTALTATQPTPTPRAPSLRGAAITGIGTALPDTVVSSAEIGERLGVDEDWIVKRVGVRERHAIAPGERLTDLATDAARRALDRAGIAPADVDLVLVGTSTGDELLPNTAPLVASALGTDRAGAADVGAACAGFLSALPLAAGMVETGRVDVCLVVGAEVPTRHLDQSDRRTMPLMGDGAGAAVIGPVDGHTRIGPSLFRSDARYADLAYMRRDDQIFRMEGQETFLVAVEELSSVTRDLLASAELTLDDIDLLVYHQANRRILQAVGQRLQLDPERVVDCVAHTGNTSAASIPIALEYALDQGRLRNGMRVLMATIAAGFVWGACIVEWTAAP
jgi:3-oxoacyl-[acyl-carrier-protein] synthase-3